MKVLTFLPVCLVLSQTAVWASGFPSVLTPSPDQSLTQTATKTAEAHAHYLAARMLESEGKMRQALDQYLAFLRSGGEDPSLVPHIMQLAATYQGAEAAIKLLDESLKSSPDDPQAWITYTTFLLSNAGSDKTLLDKAVSIADEAMKRFPRRHEVYENAVRVHLSVSDKTKAGEILQVAAKQPVQEPSFWMALGRLAMDIWPLADPANRSQHLDKINPLFEKAGQLAKSAKDQDAALEVADYYLFSSQLDKAAAICEDLVKESGWLEARKRLVRLYDALDRKADSHQALLELVKEYPDDVEHRRLLATQYLQMRDADKAVEQLEIALQLGGGGMGDYLQISSLLRYTRDTEKFDRFTNRAQQLFPGEPRIGFYRALALNSRKKYEDAAKLFATTASQAETMAPEMLDDAYHFSWGVSLERSGNYDEAAKQFDKSIHLTPPDDLSRAANTMNYLGYMWLDRGEKLDKAETLIRKANELEQNNAAFVDSLGWLFFKQGKFQEALKELLRAEALMQEVTADDAEILDHISQAYERVGDTAKAREYWQRTLDLKPQDEDIRARAEKGLGIDKPKPSSAPPTPEEPAAKK